MGVLDRFERGIERAVNGAFARAFKSEVQPVEIASSLRRAMDDRAAVVGRGRTLVPNAFVVELGPSDFARLTEYAEVLSEELVANVAEHAEAQRYVFPGPVTVGFEERDGLDTGVFQVRTATVRGPHGSAAPAPAAGARARPSHPSSRRSPRQRLSRSRHPQRRVLPLSREPFPLPPASAPTPAPAIDRLPPAQAGAIPAARRPWLDVDGACLPAARRGHGRWPRRQRRRRARRPGRLPAARRDPGDHRRAAPGRAPARPRLDERHVRRRRADHRRESSRDGDRSPSGGTR